MIAYIEKYLNEQNEVLFDFYDSNGYLEFKGPPISYENLGPSFVLVKHYIGKRLNEGSYYRLNTSLLRTLGQLSIAVVETSSIIGFSIDLNSINQEEPEGELFLDIFRPSWIDLASFAPSQRIEAIPPLFSEYNEVEIVVRRVGQGNWNEIVSANIAILVFDFGCNFRYSRPEMMELVGNKEQEYGNVRPILIVSHWDLDHYCLLKTFSSFNCFSQVYARTPPPNLTSRILYSKMKQELGPRFVRIECGESTKRSPIPLIHFVSIYGFIKLFNGEQSRSRNTSGMCCLVETEFGMAILSADHHYDQIFKYVVGKTKKEKEILVVPHHGGNAGKITLTNIGNSEKIAVISVGKNGYGHPNEEVVRALERNNYSVYVTSHHHKDFRTRI
jgi:hypothetical protein